MTVVLPTPDPALVTRFVGGDQGALVALYRQEYDGLLAAARERLGGELAHYSGRVAEKAMLDAWQARDRFENPTAFAAYLEEAVRQEADIQKRKHAALHHRQGQHGSSHITVPGVDEAASRLLETLRAPAIDHEQALAEAREAKKAHAMEHVERVGGRPKWVMATVIGVVAVGAIIGVQRYLDKAGVEVAVDRALKADGVQTLSAGKGQRGSLTLRDGTKAAIGSDSRLRIPEEFAGATMRTIALEGTATFTVSPTTTGGVPFSVRAGDVTFTAKGTVFTVRAFAEDKGVALLVTEGTVEVHDRVSDARQEVQAGSAVRIAGGAITPLDGVARDVALAWTRDSIVFDNQPLKDVVPELVRWFGMNAVIADPAVNDRPVSMRVALSSSGDATKALTQAANLSIQFGKDDRIEFNDAGVAKP